KERLALPGRQSERQLAFLAQVAKHVAVHGCVGHSRALAFYLRVGRHQSFVQVELVRGCAPLRRLRHVVLSCLRVIQRDVTSDPPYRWLASPASTRWLNSADCRRGTLNDFHSACFKCLA